MRIPLRPLTRRGLLTGTLGSAALLAAGGSLAGCGTKAATQTEAGCKSDDLSATEKTLAFSNWPQYMDVDDKDAAKRPSLDAFVAASGIKVTYTEDINDNNEFFGKVQNQLAGCQSTGRDIIVLTDWMAARMIRLGWIQKLDPAKLPNVAANLLPSLRGRSFDPENRILRPVAVRPRRARLQRASVTGEVRTVDELLTRPDLKGKVTAASEMRDTMGLLLRRTGTTRRTSPPPSSTTRSTSCARRSTPGRSASSPATTTPRTWPRATSPRASAGPAT